MDLKKLIEKKSNKLSWSGRESFSRQLWEQFAILTYLVKWTSLAAIVGLLSGTSVAVFLNLLRSGNDIYVVLPEYIPWIWFLLPPLGGLVSGFLICKFSPRAGGHGTVIRDVHQNKGEIPLSVAPVKMGASLIVILTGFSVGKEGPAAHIGAALSSFFAWCLDLPAEEKKKIVICGISGGFAAVFGTPIAGALFGVEVLFLGKVMYDVLYPSFVSGIVATWAAKLLGVKYAFSEWDLPKVLEYSPETFFYFIVAGIFFGLVSWIFIESIKLSQNIFDRIPIRLSLKPALGGIVLSIGILFLSLSGTNAFAFMGLGTSSIKASVTGGFVALGCLAFAAKIFFTSISIGSRASGGVLTPIFFIGATSGLLLAKIIPIESALLCQLGMTAVLAACANTPISASVMALELFGNGVGWEAALCCIIAYMVAGHRGVFDSQILGLRKTAALQVKGGGELGGKDSQRLSYETIRSLAKIKHFLQKLRTKK